MKTLKTFLTSVVLFAMTFILVPTTASAAGNYVLPLDSKSYTVSSHYGPRCIPIANGTTMHLGEDMGAPNGAPIYSIASGTVSHTRQGTSSQSGYVVVRSVINGETVFLEYVHMWDANKYVRIGQQVSTGQRIADVGSSGPSTAPHLHFGVWKGAYYGNGQHVEPVGYLRGLGIDINANATRVSASSIPQSCTYQSVGDLNVRSGPGTNYPVIAVAPNGTQMTHVPGRIDNKFIPVNIMGVNGWVSSGNIAFVRSSNIPPSAVSANRVITVQGSEAYSKEGDIRSSWSFLRNNAKETQATKERTAVLDRNGDLFIQSGGAVEDWIKLAGAVSQFDIEGDRIAIVDYWGNVFAKEGAPTAAWVKVMDNTKKVALSENGRLATLQNDGTVLTKEGSLYASWVTQISDVKELELVGNRIAVLSYDNALNIKEGNLYAGWVVVASGVQQFSLEGNRVGIISNDAVSVKEGSLYAGWVQQTGNHAFDLKLSDNRVIYRDKNTNSLIGKEGNLYAGWLTLEHNVSSYSVS